MIAVVPVILVYVFFSERMIRGMTKGAVRWQPRAPKARPGGWRGSV
jgi:hypothetical protein